APRTTSRTWTRTPESAFAPSATRSSVETAARGEAGNEVKRGEASPSRRDGGGEASAERGETARARDGREYVERGEAPPSRRDGVWGHRKRGARRSRASTGRAPRSI